ncbi:MAG: hypothetical protein GY813_05745 [Halieaceae bacterium]|nr:hypothetical protein [Halieaceae bacterium]
MDGERHAEGNASDHTIDIIDHASGRITDFIIDLIPNITIDLTIGLSVLIAECTFIRAAQCAQHFPG